jgi:ABC-type sugar transport system substrate-binding protein
MGAAGRIPETKSSCRIAFFSMDRGERQDLLREECLETAARYGFSVRVFQSEGDATNQVAQIQACLAEDPQRRPTVVIVNPVREVALFPAAHAAAQLGIGWVVLQRQCDYLDDLRRQYPSVPIFAVLPDQQEIGRIQGRQVLSLLPDGGELVYIRGPLGTHAAVARFAGVQEALQGSAVKVFTLTSDWTVEGGCQTMKEWARVFQRRDLPHFVVGAQNDAMAMGARDALIEEIARAHPNASIAEFAFLGCDGSPAYGGRLVAEGKLTCTVVMPVTSGRAVQEIAATLHGGPRPPAAILLPSSGLPDAGDLARSSRRVRAAATVAPPAKKVNGLR